MAKAIWNETIIAESDDTVMVEGNHYFPPESVKWEYLQPNPQKTRCFWKGQASYYSIEVDGERNEAAAWYYPRPTPLARKVKDHVAFWRGVQVIA